MSTQCTSCPPLTLVAVTIDLYDPFCSYASLQNQSSSSRGACSGFVHDRWNPGTSAEIAAALHHNRHLYLKWENYKGDLWHRAIVVALLKLHVASLSSIFIWIILYPTAKPTFGWKQNGYVCSSCVVDVLHFWGIYAPILCFSVAVSPAICHLSSSRRSSAV